MRYFYVVIAVFCSLSLRAQSAYQCLLPGTKQYFSNDRHYLRGMRIDSVRAIGTSTVFYPFHTRRVRNGYMEDSTGGSWLGQTARVDANGRTEFLNFWNNPVVIETLADSGASWIFYSDTSTLSYYATVTHIDTVTVGGTLDSVKTIQLSAMRNGIVVPGNAINNYRILLSKAHGFQEIFDLYTFPYTKPGGQAFASPFDYFLWINPYQQPAYSIFRPISYLNPLYSEVYDFQPGDMLQRATTLYELNVQGFTATNIIQDSIRSRALVPGGIEYEVIERSAYEKRFDDPRYSGTQYSAGPWLTKRFYADDPVMVLDTALMPEEGMQRYVHYYDPQDSSRCFVSAVYKRIQYNFPIPLDGTPLESAIYKVGFGLTDSSGGERFGNGFIRQLYVHLSAKKTGIQCGPFIALSVKGQEEIRLSRVYPNPAKDELTLEFAQMQPPAQFTITDVAGRTLQHGSIIGAKQRVQVSTLPDGLYFLIIRNGKSSQVHRVMIAR